MTDYPNNSGKSKKMIEIIFRDESRTKKFTMVVRTEIGFDFPYGGRFYF